MKPKVQRKQDLFRFTTNTKMMDKKRDLIILQIFESLIMRSRISNGYIYFKLISILI